MGSRGERYLHKRANLVYDIGLRSLVSLLGDPSYIFSRDGSGVSVYEWDCECSACVIEQLQTATVRWCDVHGAQMRHLHLV
jgi:hypothetical protein